MEICETAGNRDLRQLPMPIHKVSSTKRVASIAYFSNIHIKSEIGLLEINHQLKNFWNFTLTIYGAPMSANFETF